MHLQRRLFLLLTCVSAVALSPAANCQPTTRLDFSGSVFGGAGSFNNAPNIFNLFHNSPVTGSLLFDVDVPPTNPGDPNVALYVNTISAFTFLTEAESATTFGYTSVTIVAKYGIVQFYVNSIHGGFSDVFSSSFYAAPGSFTTSSLDFADLGGRIPAWGTWEFQRHEFASRQTVQYRGTITSQNFTSLLDATPIPPSEVPIAAPWLLLVVGGSAFAASRRLARGQR